MNIVDISAKRFTAKQYDSSKKIPKKHIEQLRAILRNSPSSVNSQPWHFYIVETDESKQAILPSISEFNHDRISQASHVVIFCAKTPITDEHLNNLLEQEDKDGRFINDEAKLGQDKGRRFFTNLNSKMPENQLSWESKQIYIALGNLLLSAACLGIDATPIEGFMPQKLDEILGLKEKGLSSVVIASLGYHHPDDFNAKLPKSRLPEEQLFTVI